MIKKIAWETFKNTGDINTFLEFKKIMDIENNNISKIDEIYKDNTTSKIQRVELNGNNKNQWNNNF